MSKPFFISPEVAEKLVKMGKLSQETAELVSAKKVQKHFQGGVVAPAAPAVVPAQAQPDLFDEVINMSRQEELLKRQTAEQQQAQGLLADAEQDKQDLARQMAFDAKLMDADGLRVKYGPQLERLQKTITEAAPKAQMAAQQPLVQEPQYQLATDQSLQTQEVDPILATDLQKAQPQGAKPQDTVNGLNGAYGTLEKSLTEQAKIGAEQASKEAGYYTEMANQQQKFLADQEERRAGQEQFLNDKTAQLETLIQKTSAMTVDPNRYFANKSTGQKIGMMISVILGGMNSNGQNQALQAMFKLVDQDIQAQKDNIQIAKQGVDEQKGLLSMYRQNFESSTQAEKAAHIASLDYLKTKLAAEASKSNNPMIMAKAQEAIAKIEIERSIKLQEFQKTVVSQGMVQDQALARIQQLPDNLRGAAMSELPKYQEYQSKRRVLENALNTITTGKGNKAIAEQQVLAILKGSVSNEKDLEPFKPGWFDTKKDSAAKISKALEVFDSNNQFPVLRGTGIAKPALKTLSAPVRK
jgi:hypothetical protein